MKLVVLIFAQLITLSVFAQQQTGNELRKKALDQSNSLSYDSAIHYHNKAKAQYLLEGDTNMYFMSDVDLAFEWLRKGDLEKSLDISRAAIEKGQEFMNDIDMARAYRIVGHAYNQQGNPDEATAYYEKVTEVLADNDSDEARRISAIVLSDQAILSYGKSDLYSAENLWREALEILYELPRNHAATPICEMSLNISVVLRFRGAYNEAQEYLERARPIVLEYVANPDNMLAYMYESLGSMFMEQGVIQKSHEYFLEAIRVLKNIPDSPNKVSIYIQAATSSIVLGKLETAKRLIEEVIIISEKASGYYSANTAEAYLQLGEYYGASEDPTNAVLYIQKSIDILKASELTYSLSGGNAYRLLSNILMKQGNTTEALRMARKSYDILDSVNFGQGSQVLSASLHFADKFNALDMPDSALKYRFTALKSVYPEIRKYDDNPPIASTNHHLDRFSALAGMADNLKSLYDLGSEGDSLLRLASRLLNYATESVPYIKSNSVIIRDFLEVGKTLSTAHDLGVEVSYQLYQSKGSEEYLKNAFDYTDWGKSNFTLTGVQEATALKNPGIPVDLIEKHEDLQKSVTFYEGQVKFAQTESDTISEQRYSNLLFEVRAQLDTIVNEIRAEFPAFFEVKFQHPGGAAARVQPLLDAKDLVINYHLTDSFIYRFELSANQWSVDRKVLKAGFSENIKQLLKMLQRPGLSGESLQSFKNINREVSEILLPDNLDQYDELIIIPDGYLSSLPFETLLPGSQDNARSFKELKYLLESHRLRYANSFSLLAGQMLASSTKGRARVLGFAPDFGGPGETPGAGTDSIRSGLNALAWTEREIEDINTHFESTSFIGKGATERQFRALKQDYSIIHIASHGLLNTSDPLYSRLVFSPSETDSVNDGYLNTQEIYGMNIPAEMVVLSACNSGSGDIISGEGIISLANGFFFAGSKSLVMSLWNANDQSTASVIGDFYANLAKGKTKSEAMRNAKLDFLEQADDIRSHPYYWAHLVVNGSNRPIKAGIDNTIYFLMIIGAGVVLTLMAVRRKTAKK